MAFTRDLFGEYLGKLLLKNKEIRGRMDILREENPEASGASCPYVQKDELTGKMTSLHGQGALKKRGCITFGYPGNI